MSEETKTHRDSGITCLMYHGVGEPQCIRCSACHKWVRPEKMDEACPAFLQTAEVDLDNTL